MLAMVIAMNLQAFKIAILIVSCSRVIVLASPASSLYTSLSGTLYQPSNFSLTAPPSITPVCHATLGKVTKSDCEAAISLLPRDPLMRPVMRNYYTDPSDVNATMPNQQVPFEKTSGDCTAQVLLATNFDDVPYDQTTWINLIGPARIIMRDCADGKGLGGMIVRNGNYGNLEVVLYNQHSLYGKAHTLKTSSDPVALSIAKQELLELLGLVPNIYNAEDLLLDDAASNATA